MLIGVTIAIILNLFYDYKRQRNELIENMRCTEAEAEILELVKTGGIRRNECMALSLEQSQKQTLSQKMLQSVGILQMTAQELNEYANELMLENPVVDLAEPEADTRKSIDADRMEYSSYEERYYLRQRQNNDDEYDFRDSWNINTDDGETLQEYLWSQLIRENFTEKEMDILKFMLECLDTKGYLTEETAEISRFFGVSEAEVEEYVVVLQSLEPAGICARNLQECLKLQLKRNGQLTEALEQIIDECLEMIAGNKLPYISKAYDIPMDEVVEYCRLIRALDPKPGIGFSDRERLHYIIPDVVVVKFEEYFDIMLNQSICPKIEVNSFYRSMMKDKEAKEVKEYLGKKIQQAEWVQQCIVQRNHTLLNVSNAIVKYQIDFFEKGVNYLKPLRLIDIAGELDIHESTVSRAVSNKYLQCSWGVFPLNFFFSRGVMQKKSVQASSGESVTAAGIKRALAEIIEQEDKKKPYSDRIISEKLEERGISISRRTVAKYREEDGIPGASGRKVFT